MALSSRRKTIVFVALGSCLVALVAAINVGWVLLSWSAVVPLIAGIFVGAAVITGVVLNTIFLVREIRRNEQHDAFINAVTHELKTPVASIRLYLETMQSRDLDEVQRQHFYGVMLEDSDRLSQTIEQVLAAGKAGRTRSEHLHRTRVDLSALVAECLALASRRHNLPPHSLQVETTAVGDAATVLGDWEELKRAVLNLLDNAIKYSGADVRVRVQVAQVDAKRVAVRVRDHGIGIPRDQLKQVFKRFYRVPTSVVRRVKGTGLGLFIVRSVAEQHGGSAFAESEGTGQGSTFTLQLPAAPPPDTAVRGALPHGAPQ